MSFLTKFEAFGREINIKNTSKHQKNLNNKLKDFLKRFAVCDCGISWSYSLIFWTLDVLIYINKLLPNYALLLLSADKIYKQL